VGCESTKPAPAAQTAAAVAAATAHAYPAQKRVIAIGDVHGDMDATRRALKLGGAIDDVGAWAGGDLFVVQVGDQLDRGPDDRAILDYFVTLREQAKAAGGHFVSLNGNHELMNAALDFRYVTPESFTSFADIAPSDRREVMAKKDVERGRGAAFVPGGPYALKLAEQPLYAIVGDSVFVHGGISMKHVSYGLDKADAETREWLEGKRAQAPPLVVGEDSPVWLRSYSAQTGPDDCKELERVLAALGKKRMVMGHTPQKPDISFACDRRAIRIDTGMAKHYEGRIEVLEIVGDELKVLKE
jgi:hypothetical protein